VSVVGVHVVVAGERIRFEVAPEVLVTPEASEEAVVVVVVVVCWRVDAAQHHAG
jgi:hypothetical protein